MGLTKQQLEALNVSSFPNNNAGAITPDILRQYNASVITNTVNQDTYSTDSASFSASIASLNNFSSSLDATFATDAQLNASSSTLQANINRKLDSSSFNSYTASTNTFTASISTSVGLLQTFSGSEYKADSSSFDTRIIAIVSSSIPAGTVSSSAQIVAYNIFATTASVTASINTLSSSIYLTDATQSNNITNNSASAYQVNATQSFQITANALTASNATTALSQSLFFTDTTQSVNITQASASAWGAFQSASSYSASAYQVDVSQSQQISASFATSSANSASAYQVDATQSFQITANALTASNSTTALSQSLFFTDTTQSANINSLTALTASTAYTNVNNSFAGTQSFVNVNVSGTASVAFLNVIYQSSSVIYSSGSNILGDNANDDVQTLIGRNILTGSAEVTGSLRVSSDISSSTISGIGNVTLYSASVAASITGSSANVTTLSASIYQTDSTQSYQITANALTASNATTALSQSLFFTDTTQSVNITEASASAWGAFQSASAYSASLAASITGSSANVTALSSSIYQTDATQSTNINTLTAQTASYATTGSNSFVGNQTITGSVTISGSSTTDLTVVGQIFVSSSATGGTSAPKITISGSAGITTINRNSIQTINTTNTAGIFPSTLFVNNNSTFDEIGMTIDTAGFGISGWTTGPAIYVNNDALDTYSAVFGFQNKANYTDGRVTILTPLSASAGFTSSNAFINGELYSVTSASFNTRIIAAENTGFVTTASFNAYTQSTNDFTSSITASYNATSASLNSVSSSLLEVSSSLLAVSGTVYTNTNSIIGINAKTASYATTGSNSLTGSQIITGSLTITGSVATPPVALSIASNTASIDFSKGSIYTLTLVSSSVATYITASNLTPGQTANLLVTQASVLSGSIVWASAFKFPTGSAYTGSKVVNAVDLISFITVNNSTIYSVGAQNLV
jgi:hypothetical protein